MTRSRFRNGYVYGITVLLNYLNCRFSRILALILHHHPRTIRCSDDLEPHADA
ncbi:MAG TPA: hypothetical protein VKW78_17945 [Terriglobales bacterium]|jgi:RNA:NAD 2'-phosphotransferase (TPT1/KptA family)|nr:hypothetical protein [Terriglobales bacterium]